MTEDEDLGTCGRTGCHLQAVKVFRVPDTDVAVPLCADHFAESARELARVMSDFIERAD